MPTNTDKRHKSSPQLKKTLFSTESIAGTDGDVEIIQITKFYVQTVSEGERSKNRPIVLGSPCDNCTEQGE